MRNLRPIVLFLSIIAALSVWANHPWLSRVYDYRPAPGQFVNTLPVARLGEPLDSVLARCQVSLCGRVDTIHETVLGKPVTRAAMVVMSSWALTTLW